MQISHARITIAIAVIGLLGAVTFGIGLRTTRQQVHPSISKAIDNEAQQLENSTDQSLRVVENNDSPLRILDAKVKEISGPQFTKLTGKRIELPAVSSVPEVKLLNSSGKTITAFILAIRDPETKTTRGIVQNNVAIVPGGAYTAVRETFLRPEWVSAIDKDGQLKPRLAQPGLNSEKYWISFASRLQLFVTVVRVDFHDGTVWTVREGGDIK